MKFNHNVGIHFNICVTVNRAFRNECCDIRAFINELYYEDDACDASYQEIVDAAKPCTRIAYMIARCNGVSDTDCIDSMERNVPIEWAEEFEATFKTIGDDYYWVDEKTSAVIRRGYFIVEHIGFRTVYSAAIEYAQLRVVGVYNNDEKFMEVQVSPIINGENRCLDHSFVIEGSEDECVSKLRKLALQAQLVHPEYSKGVWYWDGKVIFMQYINGDIFAADGCLLLHIDQCGKIPVNEYDFTEIKAQGEEA